MYSITYTDAHDEHNMLQLLAAVGVLERTPLRLRCAQASQLADRVVVITFQYRIIVVAGRAVLTQCSVFSVSSFCCVCGID